MSGLISRVWNNLSTPPLFLDQTDTRIEIDQGEIESFYIPLAEVLLGQQKSRLMVCVAGPPGSGKTIFATILVPVINAIQEQQIAVYVGLDGWHYPNAYLETHTTTIGNQTISLRKIKGAPETFDSDAAFLCLQRIRQGGSVRFPLYNREFHDPVPDIGIVQAGHEIIIIEGNYLLLDEGPWKVFFPLFDIRIFLDADTACLISGLRERHRRGGKDRELIEQHMLRVDLPNILKVKPGISRVQVIVHKADSKRIASIEGLNQTATRNVRFAG